MLKMGYFKLSKLGRREHLILVAFSVLFTTNIAMSNLSLYVPTSKLYYPEFSSGFYANDYLL